MIAKLSDRVFFIFVTLIILLVVLFRHPDLKATFSPSYRMKLFNQLQSDLKSNTFDAEKYWQFRERYSPGTFLRDEESVGFFSTFRIVSVTDTLTPLVYYDSQRIRSIDAVTTASASAVFTNIQEEFDGVVIAQSDWYILIQLNSSQYILAFVLPISEMQKVDGLFDYKPSEQQLLEGKQWFNSTFLEI